MYIQINQGIPMIYKMKHIIEDECPEIGYYASGGNNNTTNNTSETQEQEKPSDFDWFELEFLSIKEE